MTPSPNEQAIALDAILNAYRRAWRFDRLTEVTAIERANPALEGLFESIRRHNVRGSYVTTEPPTKETRP